MACLLVPLLVWLWARPFQGVRHDAVLYLGQVLGRLQPEVFGADVFFAFGSQDGYSIYSRILAELVRIGGFQVGSVTLIWSAHLLILWAVWRLLRLAGVPRQDAGYALVGVAGLTHLYGGLRIFGFGEEFLTARTLAEPCVLAGFVAFASRSRRGWTLPLLALAALWHPLMALPGLCIVWISASLDDRRYWWLAIVLPVAVLLGAAGVAPFDKAWLRYDDQWWSAVKEFNTQVLVTHWSLAEYCSTAFDLLIVARAGRRYQGRFQVLLRATLAVGVGGLALSLVAGDLLRNVLVLSLQPWRALWLVHVLALALVPLAVLDLWPGSAAAKLLALSLLLCATGLHWSAGWAFLLWLGMAWLIWRHGLGVRVSWLRLMQGVVILAMAGVAFMLGWNTWQHFQGSPDLAGLGWWRVPMQVPAVALAVGWGLLALLHARQVQWRVGAAALTMTGFVVGASAWDQRNDWQIHRESHLLGVHPFQKIINPTDQVYWDGDLQANWFLLGRPSFYSVPQGAGLLFNRGTAEEFSRRADHFKMLEAQRNTCAIYRSLNGLGKQPEHDDCFPTAELIRELCMVEPRLDYLVFGRDAGHGVVAQWVSPAAIVPGRDTFYLYACSALRAWTPGR